MLYNTVQVEVIKLGICNIEGLGLSSKDILIRSVAWLRENMRCFTKSYIYRKQCGTYTHIWIWDFLMKKARKNSKRYFHI